MPDSLNPIIIYQMGKVGSTTIKKSLELANIYNVIEQIHFLSWPYIQSIENDYRKQNKPIPSHILRGKKIRQQIDQSSDNIRFKIVTLVRDPVARDISDIFQNIKRDLPHILHLNQQQATDEIFKHILKILNQFDERTDYACTWFDKELKDVFQFDIFSHQFDKKQGYHIYSGKKADILVIRLENLSTCYKIAFQEFLGISDLILLQDNTGKNKWYSPIYEQILKQIDIADSVLDRIYDTRYVKHFYSEIECLALKNKWQKKRYPIDQKIPSDRLKVLFIHPEGNILGNPNFSDMVEILSEKNFDIHIFAPEKKNVVQKAPCQKSKLFLFKTKQNPSVSSCFTILSDYSFPLGSSVMDFINNNVGNYDFVIGIDRGIIEAEQIARAKNIPYALISYEIFFESEAGAQFKNPEIKACRKIAFAVVQDQLRATMLSQENKIPLSKMIYIPVAGRSANIHLFEKRYVLHEILKIDKAKKIVLFIGSIANWTMADYIIESTRYWPYDWVLVINNRYTNDIKNPYFANRHRYNKVFFCSHPVETISQLENVFLSSDMGIALYRSLNHSIGCGKNIKYVGMSSGKISTYLKYGLPTITNEIGEYSEHITKNQLGVVIDTRKPFIPFFSQEHLQKLKLNCIRFFNSYLDLNITIKPLLQLLKGVKKYQADNNEIDTTLANAEIEFQNGNIRKSLQQLLIIIDKYPKHPMALNDLGIIHWKMGEREQGIQYLKRALYYSQHNEIIRNNFNQMQFFLQE